MFKVSGTDITLTRGDTLIANIEITRNGTAYHPTAEDSIRFALKHKTMDAGRTRYTDAEPLIEKTIPYSTLVLRLESQDTKPLEFGVYVYDIQITFEDGTVDTFIRGTFSLEPEVD